GPKRLHKGIVKIVDRLEVVDRILLRFSEDSRPDQIENNTANVLAAFDSPMGKHGRDHRAKFFQGINSHPFEQLRASHMTHRCALGFLLLLGGVVERVAKEDVGITVIARVSRDDRIQSFSKSNFLHGKEAARKSASAMISGSVARANLRFSRYCIS